MRRVSFVVTIQGLFLWLVAWAGAQAADGISPLRADAAGRGNGSAQPSLMGNFYELWAIAAAVLGGCSLRGGEGSILGVLIGAAVLQVLRNAITLVGIPARLDFAVVGVVILAGVTVDELVRRLAARRRAAV